MKKLDPELKEIIEDCRAIASGMRDNREPTGDAIVRLANHLAKVATSLNWLMNETGKTSEEWPDDMSR